MSLGTLFNSVFFYPIVNLLLVFYKVFEAVKVPGAFGFAIIALTVLVRLVLHPFFKQQLETTKKMQDLKPHLDKLSAKHKNDQKKLQSEQMRLYQEAGINPASGCLFMVIQIPVFIALYQTLSKFLTNTANKAVIAEINKIVYSPNLHLTSIDPWFFGFNLAVSPAKAGNPLYLLFPVITAILQYFQASTTMMQPPVVAPEEKKLAKKGNKDEDKKDNSGDFQKAMNTQMKYLFPVMIGYFSYTLPLGLSVYWNIFSIFSIIQYRSMKALNKAK